MLGEMALMAGGVRTATVRAATDVEALTVSYSFFQASLDQLSVPAYKILRRVTESIGERLSDLNAKLISFWIGDRAGPPAREMGGEASLTAANRTGPWSFDYRSFLPLTPFFQNFSAGEIDRLVERAVVLEVPKETYLYREADPARSSFVIVRGAVEQSVTRSHHHQLSIFGPGRMCGGNAMITGKPHDTDAMTRSRSLLLEIDENAFEDLVTATCPECLKFQSAIGTNQLIELKAADNLLTTLVSQAHVHDEIRENSG
jgi:CRP-like cAMP-binding protein